MSLSSRLYNIAVSGGGDGLTSVRMSHRPVLRIVLGSQCFGLLLDEWKGAPRRAILIHWVSIAVIVVGVLVLGVSSALIKTGVPTRK